MVEEGPELVTIELQGPCNFTGKDISNIASDFDVLNPDIHIATLTEEKKLSIDLRISQ